MSLLHYLILSALSPIGVESDARISFALIFGDGKGKITGFLNRHGSLI